MVDIFIFLALDFQSLVVFCASLLAQAAIAPPSKLHAIAGVSNNRSRVIRFVAGMCIVFPFS